jgi:hypothetical protein
MTAYTAAQQSEQAGRLGEAKDLLLTCTKSGCGKLVQQECLTRYARLESDIPTVVLHFAGEKGAPAPDVQIRIDGALVTSRPGEPVAVDPGLHEFTFGTTDGVVQSSQKVMILQGDVNHPIAVPQFPLAGSPPTLTETAGSTGASDKPAQVEAERPLPPPGPVAVPFILGGVGVAGVGAGVALLAVGKQNTWNLAVDSLAVGAGALAGALWLFASRHSEKKPPPRAAYAIDVRPFASGGIASLSGVF